MADSTSTKLSSRELRSRKKEVPGVGKTKRGKGTKIMAVADNSGLLVAVCAESATLHEVALVQQTLAEVFIAEAIQGLLGDNAYDSDRLDEELAATGDNRPTPNNRKHRTQDGRLCVATAVLEDRTSIRLGPKTSAAS